MRILLPLSILLLLLLVGTPAQPPEFESTVKPFLKKNCAACHNGDNLTAGVRVDHLDASLDERHIRVWEGVLHRVREGTMPPKGLPQPTPAQRDQIVQWIEKNLEVARLRPAPKNGSVRRLTVAQYRNTLRELFGMDDNLTEGLPPDAISADGFVNNQETLQLNPLLIESYLEIAEEALSRAIVNPAQKPTIQNFRLDFGAGINKNPIQEKLILGAGSALLDPSEFTVTELTPIKPFAFNPFRMRTKYRFIEGYQGNDTVRGWREFDSIYHAVFADMRGSGGYPKGKAHSVVPEGLLLRPAIPNDEIFEGDGTYGPKANFKIAVRELPDRGRFRVTVTAAKYNDGLLLDKDAAPAPASPQSITLANPVGPQTIQIAKAGVYQVDLYRAQPKLERPPTDSSQISKALIGVWTFDQPTPNLKLEGKATLAPSPFGQALSLTGPDDYATFPRGPETNFSIASFTISFWIKPTELRKSGIIAAGNVDYVHGWFVDMPDNRGTLRLETTGPDGTPNGTLRTPPGVLRPGVWQHVAIIAPRLNQSRIYVNGYQVAEGNISPAPLDNPKIDLHFGRIPGQPSFLGQIDDVRFYTRPLAAPEMQALIEPGREFALPPPERVQDVHLILGDRHFVGALQTGFLHVRLPAGPLSLTAKPAGNTEIEKVVITPVTGQAALRRFATFEQRQPRLGVHLGFRRDCGSTFARVGEVKPVSSTSLQTYTFEGEISNYPSTNVEKDNVNYLAGIREIAVRSEYTDGRDMPRLLIRSVEFEGPFLEAWPPPTHRKIFPATPQRANPSLYAREVLSNFASRAWRRPATPGEVNHLHSVFTNSYRSNKDFERAIKDSLAVVLTSPQFLFLIEKSASPAAEPLDDYELASKLSYFLWNGPPDATTLRLARAGALRQNLNAEVTRLIANPRFERFLEEFATQWLALDKIMILEPDKKRFPDLVRATRSHLRQEPIAFLRYLLRNNLPLREFITSDIILANEVTASYYGLGDKVEQGFDFLPIRHNRKELGGILSQAAILAGLSDGRESNPVKRGAWLARRIIAEPPSDPPPNVPALGEDTKGLTLRQRIEQHRSQSGCFQCHAKIDPWGIALEEFDADGRWKQYAVDASSHLPDKTKVGGAIDLKRYLAEDRLDQVAFSVLKHLAIYATGRNLTYNEMNFLKQDSRQLRANGYRMQDLLRYVVNSKIFLEK